MADATVLFSDAHGAAVLSGAPTDVVVTAASYGQVWVWAPRTVREFPDRLVLTGRPAASADGAAAPVYEKALGLGAPDTAGCPYAYTFRANDNDAGEALDAEAAGALTFALVHYPGGGGEHGVALFEGREAGDVFRSDGTSETSMANLVAVHAYLSDEVLVRVDVQSALGTVGLTIEPPPLPDPDPLGLPFLAPHVPVTTVAVESRAWKAGGLAADTEGVPDATRAAIDRSETWLYLARRVAAEVSVAEGAFDAHAVGAWKVEADGRYQFHAYADDAAPEAEPAPVGAPADAVLVSSEWVVDRESSVYGWVAPHAVPAGRVETALGRLRWGTDPGLTPLGFDGDDAKREDADDDVVPFVLHTSHARWVPADRVWRWFLPDPLRVTARLSAQARVAAERYAAWVTASAPALQNAGLLAAMCFDPDHHRGHLTERLGPAGGFDMAAAWGGDRQPGRPTTRTALDHFRYGVERQGAYLKARARAAGGRLETWLATPHVHGTSVDLVAGTLGTVPTETTEALAEIVFDGLLAAFQAGSGGHLFAWALEEVRPGVASFEDLEAALATFAVPDEATVEERLGGPTAKMWFTVLRRASKATAKLFAFSSACAGGLGWLSGPRTFQNADAVARVTALFADSIFGHAPGGGPPPPSGPYDQTRAPTTWDAADGTTQTYKAGPVRLVRKRFAASHRRSYTGWDVWEVQYERTVDIDWWQGANTALNMMNAGLMGASIHQAVRDGDVGAKEAVDAAKIGLEIAKLVEAFGTAADSPMVRLSGVIKWAGPGLDVATGVVAFYAEANEQRRVGAQRYADPDEIGMMGAACLVLGGVLGLAAVPVGGTVGATAGTVLVVYAVTTQAVGAIVLWRRGARLLAEQLSDDPLTPWLGTGSMWGVGSEVPSGVLALARPGWQARRAVPVAAGLILEAQGPDGRGGGQTGMLVRTAYTFPVRVHVDETGAAPRVVLYVRPEYVPETGTVVVSGTVRSLRGAGIADVRCAVHFAESSGGGFRYTVRAPGDPLPPDADPAALAAGWAPSTATGPPDRDGRPAHELPVYLGDGWPPPPAAPFGLGAAGPPSSSPTAPVPAVGSVADGLGRVAAREWAGRVSAHRAAAGLGDAVVWGGTRADVAGLAAAVRGGRFSVAGTAFFRPAEPFDPAATVPETGPDGTPTDPFLARSRFERTVGPAAGAGTAAPTR